MGVIGQDCDCAIIYGVREAQFRALNDDGSIDAAADWYATDCPVEIGLDPEIEEGATNKLKCGDVIKNSMKGDNQLTGMTIKFSMGCRNPEVEYIIAGSVGTITYDASSPPCAIGYCPPTLAEQSNAVPFEMRFYRSEKEGSNDVGFEEIHVYQCLPSFVTLGGSQEEYGTQEWSISAVENPTYDTGIAKPVYCWEVVASIPT
jgi:hypothetical protein